jgi:hypothetical protein
VGDLANEAHFLIFTRAVRVDRHPCYHELVRAVWTEHGAHGEISEEQTEVDV